MDNSHNTHGTAPQGFKFDKAGKLRTEAGTLVAKDYAEQVIAGSIITGFDIEDLKKKKARKIATGGVDMIAAINAISPAIGLLKVGHTAKIAIPDPKEKRSFIMQVVTKLNSLTYAGREWAGRVFDTAGSEDGSFLYVARKPDTDTPAERKQPGPRKAKDAAATGLAGALDRAKEHLNGPASTPTEEKEAEKAADAIEGGDTLEIGKEAGGEIIEDAVVVQH